MRVDGMSAYKKGLQKEADYLKDRQSLSEYQKDKAIKKTNKSIEKLRESILRM